MNFKDTNHLKDFIANEVLLTHEATKYLGISSQRLHQLVQSGKIKPIKSTRTGSLFLKEELYERRFEVEKNYGYRSVLTSNDGVNSPEVINDAITYFTLLALFRNKFKECNPIYNHLTSQLDTTKEISSILNELAELTGFEKKDIIYESDIIKKGFEKLREDDRIVKIGSEFYPSMLEQTEQAPMFLFMRGNPNLLKFNIISVVGTRNPSKQGELRARVLAERLGMNRIVVASGLAKGIDTNAHLGAINSGNPTIAVIGTPLNKYYPKQNEELQKKIEENFLVISQFAPSMSVQRWNFPMRNAVMSGISLATVIVEAGETSGSLIQADYALKQGRLVFIPQSAIDSNILKWPKKYIQKRGALKFSKIEDLLSQLAVNKKDLFLNITEKKPPAHINEVSINYVHKDE